MVLDTKTILIGATFAMASAVSDFVHENRARNAELNMMSTFFVQNLYDIKNASDYHVGQKMLNIEGQVMEIMTSEFNEIGATCITTQTQGVRETFWGIPSVLAEQKFCFFSEPQYNA